MRDIKHGFFLVGTIVFAAIMIGAGCQPPATNTTVVNTTKVDTNAALLASTPSAVVALTDAWLDAGPEPPGVTVSSTVAPPAEGRVPSEQRTGPAVAAQDPWLGTADTSVAPTGSQCSYATFAAATGPALPIVAE